MSSFVSTYDALRALIAKGRKSSVRPRVCRPTSAPHGTVAAPLVRLKRLRLLPLLDTIRRLHVYALPPGEARASPQWTLLNVLARCPPYGGSEHTTSAELEDV